MVTILKITTPAMYKIKSIQVKQLKMKRFFCNENNIQKYILSSRGFLSIAANSEAIKGQDRKVIRYQK